MDTFKQIKMHDITSGKALTLDCPRLLRQIPRRRTVYEGNLDGKDVIVKCFAAGLHGRHHYKQEIHGFKELTLRNIKTAEIVAAGPSDDKEHVVVLSRIDNAADVFNLVTSEDTAQDCHSVLKGIFECIARMHNAGVLQPDLHLGNFLWDGETIYVLDPAEMIFSQTPLDKEASFQQLAVLLGSLPETYWADKNALLEEYFNTRGWKFNSDTAADIETRTEQQRFKRMRPALRKTLRTSKRYIKVQKSRFRGVFTRDLLGNVNLLEFMSGIDEQMEAGDILKRGNTCFVSRIKINGQDIVVKRYNHKGFVHSIRHTIKSSRAQKCWLFGHRLNELEIATAQPLGFFEHRKAGMVWQSYILNTFIEGPDIQTYLSNPANTDKKIISAKVSSMLDKLVRFHMTHGDLKAGNILIHQGNPVLIDLDSMKRHRCRKMLQLYKQKMDDNIAERNILWKK